MDGIFPCLPKQFVVLNSTTGNQYLFFFFMFCQNYKFNNSVSLISSLFLALIWMWIVDGHFQCLAREFGVVESTVIVFYLVAHISNMASKTPGNGHTPARRSRSLQSTQDTQEASSASKDSGSWQDLSDPDGSEQGYDMEFCDEEVIKRFECPICLLTCRDPWQTPCGHLFCRACITKWCR